MSTLFILKKTEGVVVRGQRRGTARGQRIGTAREPMRGTARGAEDRHGKGAQKRHGKGAKEWHGKRADERTAGGQMRGQRHRTPHTGSREMQNAKCNMQPAKCKMRCSAVRWRQGILGQYASPIQRIGRRGGRGGPSGRRQGRVRGRTSCGCVFSLPGICEVISSD